MGSQFFRTTNGIQSGPYTFDKSRSIMTFLTILRITKILCRFRRKNRNKIYILESSRSEFLEKFSANNFALSGAEGNTSGLLNREGRFTFVENTIGNLPKVQRAKIAYLNFTLDSEDLSFCYKQKRLFLWPLQQHK